MDKLSRGAADWECASRPCALQPATSSEDARKQDEAPQKPAAVPKAPARPKLDPKDFEFVGLKGVIMTKAPGWAAGT